MRILQVTDWNPGRGGSEAYVEWLLGALPRVGHEVRLLTSNASSVDQGESGLLFENGNADELLAHLEAVASRRVFPRQQCNPAVVRSLRERHDPVEHLTRLTAFYRAVRSGTVPG